MISSDDFIKILCQTLFFQMFDFGIWWTQVYSSRKRRFKKFLNEEKQSPIKALENYFAINTNTMWITLIIYLRQHSEVTFCYWRDQFSSNTYPWFSGLLLPLGPFETYESFHDQHMSIKALKALHNLQTIFIAFESSQNLRIAKHFFLHFSMFLSTYLNSESHPVTSWTRSNSTEAKIRRISRRQKERKTKFWSVTKSSFDISLVCWTSLKLSTLDCKW